MVLLHAMNNWMSNGIVILQGYIKCKFDLGVRTLSEDNLNFAAGDSRIETQDS